MKQSHIQDQFTYLGATFDTTGNDLVETGRRVIGTRRMIGYLKATFFSQEIGKKSKYNIYNILIKSSLLYDPKA